MTRYTGTPVAHEVFNELDRHGLLLGLPRLAEEENPAYKQRLFDVMVHRADSTYMGLLNSITRELGYSFTDTLTITAIPDGDTYLADVPAVVFQDTKCYLYKDFSENDIVMTIDRFDSDGTAWTLGNLVSRINVSGYFTATLLNDLDPDLRAMTIFNQKSYETVPFEEIHGRGIEIHLKNRNLVPGTVSIRSANLVHRVGSQILMRQRGDFYIDYTTGTIYSVQAPGPGDTVRYQYFSGSITVQSTPVIIHNIQSADFQTKMFAQLLDGEGDTIDTLPTILGADIINELLSAYPVSWGR